MLTVDNAKNQQAHTILVFRLAFIYMTALKVQ